MSASAPASPAFVEAYLIDALEAVAVMTFAGSPFLRVVTAFLRSPSLDSISLSYLYCFCMPNLKGPAMREPSMARVSAVAFDWIVFTLRSLCNFTVLANISFAFFPSF